MAKIRFTGDISATAFVSTDSFSKSEILGGLTGTVKSLLYNKRSPFDNVIVKVHDFSVEDNDD